jgi:hypothetical protein
MQNYQALKDAGLVQVALANGSPAILIQHFDPNTGQPVEIEEQTVDVVSLQSQIDNLTNQQSDLTALITDAQSQGLSDIATAKDAMSASIAAKYSTIIQLRI